MLPTTENKPPPISEQLTRLIKENYVLPAPIWDEDEYEQPEPFSMRGLRFALESDDVPFKFRVPSNILNVGQSRSGKSSLIEDMILHDRIQPRPDRTYIMVGESPKNKKNPSKVRGDTLTRSEKLAPYLSALFHGYKVDTPDKIQVPETVDEMINDMYDRPNHERKLVILDDMMTQNRYQDQISQVALSGMHHNNAAVFYNVQDPFHKNNVNIRGNADTLILWPASDVDRGSGILKMYPAPVRDHVVNILTRPGQVAKDMVTQYMVKNKIPIPEERIKREPAIIDRRTPGGRIVVYRGPYDSYPVEYNGDVDISMANEEMVGRMITQLKRQEDSSDQRSKRPLEKQVGVGALDQRALTELEDLEEEISEGDLKRLRQSTEPDEQLNADE